MGLEARGNNICPFCGSLSKIMFKVEGRVFFECQNKQCRAMFEKPEPQIPYEYDQSLQSMTKQYEFMLDRYQIAVPKIIGTFKPHNGQDWRPTKKEEVDTDEQDL